MQVVLYDSNMAKAPQALTTILIGTPWPAGVAASISQAESTATRNLSLAPVTLGPQELAAQAAHKQPWPPPQAGTISQVVLPLYSS